MEFRTSTYLRVQRKSFFTACHSGKLKLTFTNPNIISTSPKNVLMSRLISQFFCNLNSSNNFTCLSGKLMTEFTSPIAKSTSLGLSDTTLHADIIRICKYYGYSIENLDLIHQSLILSVFTYAIEVWGCTLYSKYFSRIDKLFARC